MVPAFQDHPFSKKYGLKLKVVLKWKDIYIENIIMVSLIAGLKIEEFLKGGVLNHRDHCTYHHVNLYCHNFRIKTNSE